MGLHELAERGTRPCHEGGEGRGALLQPGEPAVGGGVAPLQRRSQAAKPRRGPGAAQDRPLHGPDGAAPRRRRYAAGGQRMLESGEQGNRRRVFGNEPRGEPEIRARHRFAERHTGRIVHRDLPAPELRRDPAGQRAVQRNERGGAAGGLQGAPHDDGDGARFLLRARTVDAVEIAVRLGLLRRSRAPGGDGLRRPHGDGDQSGAGTGGAGARPLFGRPRLNGLARNADMREQTHQRVLRMGGADGLPRLVVRLRVEAGEDDGALRQACDGGQQVAGGRDAPGRARADHRIVRWLRLPPFDEARQQGVTASGRIHLAPLRQDGRPTVGDEREEAQHLLPMGRVFLRRERGQSLRVDPGDLNLVQQTGKRLSKPRGLIHGPRPGQRRAAGSLAEPLDQAR